MKPTANDHKYPRFSCPEKSLKNIHPYLSYSSLYIVGALRAALLREMSDWVIRPNPLACPWLDIARNKEKKPHYLGT